MSIINSIRQRLAESKDSGKDVRIIKKLIWSLYPAQASASLLSEVNSVASSILVGRFFGCDALAAMGFIGPLTQFVKAIDNLVYTGSSIICGKALGAGKKDKIRQVFNTTFALCVLLVALITLLLLLFSRPVALLLGTAGTDTDNTALYILGYGVGIGFYVMCGCLYTCLELERMDKMLSLMPVITIVFNIGGNLANIFFLHWGLFGIGLFSSIGNVIAVLIILPYILIKGKLFRLSLKDIELSVVTEVLKAGSPSTVLALAGVFRGRVINQFVYALGGAYGMAAVSIAGSCSNLISVAVTGLNKVFSNVINLLVGQRDIKLLKKLPGIMVSYSFPLYLIPYLLIAFVFGEPIALLFGAEATQLSMVVTSMRVFASWIFIDMFTLPAISMYQAMGKTWTVNIVSALCSGVIPIAMAYTLGNLLGFYFIVGLGTVVEVITLIAYGIVYYSKTRRLPSPLGICFIPDSMSVAPEDSIVTTVSTVEEVVNTSKQVVDFCKRKGLSSRASYYCGLCIEEMAVDTIVNRFKSQNATIDLRLFYEGDHVRIMLRDSCQHFDPNEWLALCAPEDELRSLGIRMVSKLAGEMNYVNSLGLNILMIDNYKQQ